MSTEYIVSDKPVVLPVTKSLAIAFRDMEPCPNDRALSEKRMDLLKKIVQDDRFRVCEWSSCFCEETGKEYRVNGKHTSTVFSWLLENGSPEKIQKLRVLVTKYKAHTLEGVARLYASFDTKAATRTSGDINRVYAQADPKLAGLSGRSINLAVTGIYYVQSQFAGNPGVSLPDARAMEMLSHPDYVLFLDRLLTAKEKSSDVSLVSRGPVAAAVFSTFKKAPLKASEFWLAVRDGSDPSPTSTTRTLNKLLMKTAVAYGIGALVGRTKPTMTGREMYAKCVYAWNAWREGREHVVLKYLPAAALPRPRA
jgi:hypothetical protein